MPHAQTLAAALLLAAAIAAPAAADPRPNGPVAYESAKVCLDTLGIRHAPSCHNTNASRISPEPEICLCGAGLREAPTSYCAPGERHASDSAEFDRARLAAVKATGTLVGASYKGRSFCVTRGRTGETY